MVLGTRTFQLVEASAATVNELNSREKNVPGTVGAGNAELAADVTVTGVCKPTFGPEVAAAVEVLTKTLRFCTLSSLRPRGRVKVDALVGMMISLDEPSLNAAHRSA